MSVNRDGDGDGDECFHDVLDFTYALQPAVYGRPVARGDFLGVARGEVVLAAVGTPLRASGLASGDFERLVSFLLVMYLEGSEEGLEALPRDFAERRDKVVAAFFGGGAASKEEIDFMGFDEALSAGASEMVGGGDVVTNEFVSVVEPLVPVYPVERMLTSISNDSRSSRRILSGCWTHVSSRC